MRQTLLISVFVNFSLPFQPSVPFIQCSEVFVYYNLLQELIFMIKQICIEGLWLNIPRAVDVERTVSKQGFGSIALAANFRTSRSNFIYAALC